MGVQIIVDAPPEIVSRALGELAEYCEIFPMGQNRSGLSIPTKVYDEPDEEWLRERLPGLTYYDLYAGEWITSSES
jgi:hypothetical protein